MAQESKSEETESAMANSHRVRDLNRRFCVLEYRPVRDESKESACDSRAILLVIEEEHQLQFFATADFRSIVHKADLEYIEQLLKDLPMRARRDAKVLFDQLCSLSVGPLITGKVGTFDANSADFEQICAGFISV